MDRTSWFRLCAASLVFLGGCSSLPASKVNYYLPASTLTVELDRVVGCDKQHHIRVADSVTTSVTNSADRTFGPMTFDLTSQRSHFADSDVTFEFTKDSRLSSINAVSTGQGGAIVKTIGLVGMNLAVFGLDNVDKPWPIACAAIANSDGKPVTLVYKQTFIEGHPEPKSNEMLAPHGLEKSVAPIPLIPDAESSVLAEAVDKVLGNPRVEISAITTLGVPIMAIKGKPDDFISVPRNKRELPQDVIYARAPRFVSLLITATGGDKYKIGANASGDTSIADVSTVVAGDHRIYAIPVQGPRLFGYKKVVVTFDDNGALTKLEYASNTGLVSSSDAFNALLTDRVGLDAAKAKAINDKTDIIVANNRRIACETGSTNCK